MHSDYKFISLSKTLSPRQNSLYTHFKNHKVIFIYSRNKRPISKLIDLFIQLIQLKSNSFKKEKFIVGNNSIFLTLIIKLVFPRSYLIKDIGYFAFDIKELALIRKILYLISDLISIIISDQILFESDAQIKRFKKYKLFNLYKKKYKTFYVFKGEVNPERYINKKSLINEYKYFNSKNKINVLNSDYFLFRGKFNNESGIDKLAKYFIGFSNINNTNIPFFILGDGPLYSKLLNQLRQNKKNNIILIREYLSNENLSLLIENSCALFGQFEDKNPRIKYTLPNKFFESMLNKKAYITPHYPSFDFLENNNIIYVLNDISIKNYDLPNKMIEFFTEFKEFSTRSFFFKFELVIIIPNGNFYEKIIKLNSRI